MRALPIGKEIWNPSARRLLADGAWGTEFIKRGLAMGEAPERWNLERPEDVRAVARSYLEAGADLIQTNSFGATRLQLERHGLADKTVEINLAAARISVQEAEKFRDPREGGRWPLVIGVVGPTGKLLVMEEVDEETLLAAFAEQAQALASGGVDWLLVETMIDKSEMALAVKACAATGLPVVASMTYSKGEAGYRTVMGDSPESCVSAALEAGASVVGANCGSGIEAYVELAHTLRALTDAPLWIKANAGLPEVVEGNAVYPTDATQYCATSPRLLEAGVNVVGGCCGTSPTFIATARPLIT